MDTGNLVTFEGIEGSGKTTQLKILEDHLTLRGVNFVSTREPGGTRIGNEIRNLLLDPENQNMVATTELLLYAAARAQHISEFIRPALSQGKLVLCDRFLDATRAYQGFARGLPKTLIDQLNEMATGGIFPRATILLDCPVTIGLGRAYERFQTKNGAQKGDRIEQEEMEFHERVREGYLQIAKDEPNRVFTFDATQDIDTIHQAILRELNRFLA